MRKSNAEKARNLDWTEYASTRPREAVTQPKGKARTDLIQRLRKAFQRAKLKQTA